jgi:hypothetical protein
MIMNASKSERIHAPIRKIRAHGLFTKMTTFNPKEPDPQRRNLGGGSCPERMGDITIEESRAILGISFAVARVRPK